MKANYKTSHKSIQQMSNASQEVEAAPEIQRSAPNPSQAVDNSNSNQQALVASGNNDHNINYNVASTPEGNIVVTINAPVQSYGTCTSCGSDQVCISTANEVYSQSITIGPSFSGNETADTASNENQLRDVSGPRELSAPCEQPVPREQPIPQQVQLPSEQTVNQPSTQQSTDEQAMDVEHSENSAQAATVPHTSQDSSTQKSTDEQAMDVEPSQDSAQAATVPHMSQDSFRAAQTPNQALQAYLIHQQRLAGIAPEDMIMIPRQRNLQQQQAGNGQRGTPSVIQISKNGGVRVPQIPPASFNVAALPIRTSPRARRNYSQAANGNARSRGSALGQIANRSDSTISREQSTSTESNRHHGSQPVDQDSSQTSLNPESQSQATEPANEATLENEGQNEGGEGGSKIACFDILGALTSHPWVEKRITDYLSPNDFVNTCMASRRFNEFVKANNVFITDPMSNRTFPYCRKIFNYVCYRKLHVYVPNPTPNLTNGLPIHRIPTLKWFRMLEFRTAVIDELMLLFNQYGYALTSKCQKVLFKIWFLMDIPDNHRRLKTIQSGRLWSNLDIFHGIFVLAQIESFFSLNKVGASSQEFRRLAMAQKSPILLRDAMKGTALNSHFEVVKEFIHWCYNPPPSEDGTYLFGNSPDQVGKLQYEYHGHNGNTTRLQRPDELIIRECADRKLDTFKMYSNLYVHSECDQSLSQTYDTERDSYNFVREIRLDAERTNTADTYMEQVILDDY